MKPLTRVRHPGHQPVEGHGGHWFGTPGESAWFSQNDTVKSITGGAPVLFRRGYPDFSPWALERYTFNAMNGTSADFTAADWKLAQARGLADAQAARRYRSEAALTWHHHQDCRTLLLLPRALHDNVLHSGGASLLRARQQINTPAMDAPFRHTRQRRPVGLFLPPPRGMRASLRGAKHRFA